ncbi:pirin family protein [Aeromicrobium marinum DSM 15272]|uniref:Pirin family protein n=1 Tax=Aeromicrobium marinum DSM 15272 TaxID=585531 RepID=E2SBJ4_9ACTN|nr:pirin family protein [Aeromicrobium marinum]EFQ83740.1 pirin family protein [Aeromicrobium marinum DSM 15272]
MTPTSSGPVTLDARDVPLGGVRGLTVHRTLPYRDLPTVGAWCFVDHFGPTDARMEVLPHPHTGLQTVTWPLAGLIRHRDSLGSDVVLRPGELNLMTSGAGVSHSEFSADTTSMHGVQLWVALPEHRRHGAPDFEHLPDLPAASGAGWEAIVFVGSFGGVTSPATVHTPMVGAQLVVEEAQLDLEPTFEHALLAVDGPVEVDGVTVQHRDLRYLPVGAEQVRVAAGGGRVLLIGGEPFDEDLVMWWNFIGRSHDEIEAARADWESAPTAGRFGHVEGHDDRFIPAPPLPGVRLTPRRRR